MTADVFCAIIAGEQQAHVVADTPDGVAFLDRRPVFPGHTLVVPRDHIETLVDLPAALLPGYMASAVQRTSASPSMKFTAVKMVVPIAASGSRIVTGVSKIGRKPWRT